MPKQLTDEEIELAAQRLTKKEHEQLLKFINSSDPSLEPTKQAKIFALYLAGRTTWNISQDKSLGASWGQIVHAKVLGEWDDKLREHTESLLLDTVGKVRRLNLDSIDVMAEYINVANDIFKKRVEDYKNNKDEAAFGMAGPAALKQYAQAIEVLKSLTVQHKSTEEQSPSSLPPPKKKYLELDKAPSGDEAADVMRKMLEKKD